MRLWTFGHGTAAPDELGELLRESGIEGVVDVRSAPGSRHNPDMARSRMRQWLPEQGIGYRWERRLGGFRRVPSESPDTAWHNDSFRAYAAHMRADEFLAGFDELRTEAGEHNVAVMCSESVWWRCHRRMIADFAVLAHGGHVTHLMHDGRHTAHQPTEFARLRDDGLVVYDAGQQNMLAE